MLCFLQGYDGDEGVNYISGADLPTVYFPSFGAAMPIQSYLFPIYDRGGSNPRRYTGPMAGYQTFIKMPPSRSSALEKNQRV